MDYSMRLLIFSLLILSVVPSQRSDAQPAVRYSAFGSGGGTTSDSQFRITFTSGQPLIGVMAGPSNTHQAGFWYVQRNVFLTDVEDVPEALPTAYGLEQNYPNPFNPETKIRFQLPQSSHVTVKIYDILGRPVSTLADGHYDAGYHVLTWTGHNAYGGQAASGVYFYRIQADKFTEVRKMILLR